MFRNEVFSAKMGHTSNLRFGRLKWGNFKFEDNVGYTVRY